MVRRSAVAQIRPTHRDRVTPHFARRRSGHGDPRGRKPPASDRFAICGAAWPSSSWLPRWCPTPLPRDSPTASGWLIAAPTRKAPRIHAAAGDSSRSGIQSQLGVVAGIPKRCRSVRRFVLPWVHLRPDQFVLVVTTNRTRQYPRLRLQTNRRGVRRFCPSYASIARDKPETSRPFHAGFSRRRRIDRSSGFSSTYSRA